MSTCSLLVGSIRERKKSSVRQGIRSTYEYGNQKQVSRYLHNNLAEAWILLRQSRAAPLCNTPNTHQSQMFHYQCPQELLDEITSYLWNDIPSLKACSLAHRNMTVSSQKRLFYSVGLQAPGNPLIKNEISGTSYGFWRLLVESPYIAGYVQSLFIMDFDCSSHDPTSSEDDQTESGLLHEGYELGNEEYGKTVDPTHRFWIVDDKYLPRCAPLLHNLKALTLDFDCDWQCLSPNTHIALLRLMCLPSLLCVRHEFEYPSALFNVAIGDNVKHVVLHGFPESIKLSALPRCPSSRPLYVDSLDIYSLYGFLDSHFKNPNCRIETSRLRKLAVSADTYDNHAAIWTILQTCCETLEDFEFTPSEDGKLIPHRLTHSILLSVHFPVIEMDHDSNPDDPIDLSKLILLKRFAVHLLAYSFDCSSIPWFNRILLPKNAPPAGHQLQELSIFFGNYDQENDLLPFLKDTFDIFHDNRFKTPKKVNISVESEGTDADMLDLNSSEVVAKLRSQDNVILDVRGKHDAFSCSV